MDKPIIIKNFLNGNDINFLMDWLTKNEYKFDEHVSSVDYWNSRCIHYTSVDDQNIKNFLYKIVNSMRDILEIIISPQNTLYVEEPQFVRWPTGIELPPHADNIEPDGVTPNTSPWRSHGGVIYFNDDFEGGEIYYPFLDNLTVKPEPGMMVIHSADLKHTHGVKKVTSGTRQTMSVFFTYDKAHRIIQSGSSQLL
jgi:hypothetical protein